MGTFVHMSKTVAQTLVEPCEMASYPEAVKHRLNRDPQMVKYYSSSQYFIFYDHVFLHIHVY